MLADDVALVDQEARQVRQRLAMAREPVAHPLGEGADRLERPVGEQGESACGEDQGKDDHPVGERAQQGRRHRHPAEEDGRQRQHGQRQQHRGRDQGGRREPRDDPFGRHPAGVQHLEARGRSRRGAAGDHLAHGVARELRRADQKPAALAQGQAREPPVAGEAARLERGHEDEPEPRDAAQPRHLREQADELRPDEVQTDDGDGKDDHPALRQTREEAAHAGPGRRFGPPRGRLAARGSGAVQGVSLERRLPAAGGLPDALSSGIVLEGSPFARAGRRLSACGDGSRAAG